MFFFPNIQCSNRTQQQKYFNPLKSQENASLIDAQTVDEIFLMVPDILHIHQQFLEELRRRLEIWEPLQRVGDAFVQVVMSLRIYFYLQIYFFFLYFIDIQEQQQ